MTIVAGSTIKLAAEYAGKGLLGDIAQIHGDIKNRALGGALRLSRQQ